MKKLIIVLALASSVLSYGQSTATDFTVTNCDGESYNLFQDLDAGNVVVIAWVMPCVSCIADPVTAFSVTKEYDPEKVKFFIADDYADHECSVIQTWSENYQMGDVKKFSSELISMSDYGVDGMPKIVVLGCKTRKVFFNENSSSEGIKDAIDLALVECAISGISDDKQIEDINLTIYPNPVSQDLTIDSKYKEPFSMSIVNAQGKIVYKTDNFFSKASIDLSNFSEGVYFLKYLNQSKSFIVNK